MTRIISGAAGSLRLKGPAKATRPTSDRVKESLFARLESMNVIEGARVLDLYAGTGALGLEAASRGASEVLFIESDQSALRVIEHNAELVGKAMGDSVSMAILPVVVQRFLRKTRTIHDLVLMDPPYSMSAAEIEKDLLRIWPLLPANGLVVVERPSRQCQPLQSLPFREVSKKFYGETEVTILMREDMHPPPVRD